LQSICEKGRGDLVGENKIASSVKVIGGDRNGRVHEEYRHKGSTPSFMEILFVLFFNDEQTTKEEPKK